MIGSVAIQGQSCSPSTTIKSDFDYKQGKPPLPHRSSLRALRPAPLRPSPIKKPSPPSDHRYLPPSTPVRCSNQSPLRIKSRAACQSSALAARKSRTPVTPAFNRSLRSKPFRLGRRVHITRNQTLARSLLTRRAVLKAPKITPLYKVMSGPMRDQVTEDGHLQSQSGTENPVADLSVMIDQLLEDLSSKFNAVSAEIFAKMDDMSRRLDNLEASIESQSVSTDGTKTP